MRDVWALDWTEQRQEKLLWGTTKRAWQAKRTSRVRGKHGQNRNGAPSNRYVIVWPTVVVKHAMGVFDVLEA